MNSKSYFSFRQPSDWQNGVLNNIQINEHGLSLQREQRYRHSKRVSFQAISEQDIWLDAYEGTEGWFWLDDQNTIYRFEKQFRQRELILRLELNSDERAYRIAIQGELAYVLTYTEAQTDRDEASQLYCFYLSNGQLRWKLDNWKNNSFIGYELVVTEYDSIVVLAKLSTYEYAQLLYCDTLGYPINEEELTQFSLSISLGEVGSTWNCTYRIVSKKEYLYIYDSVQRQMIKVNSISHYSKYIPLPYIEDHLPIFAVDDNEAIWIIHRLHDEEIQLININSEGEMLQQGQLMIDNCHYFVVFKHTLIVCDVVEKLAYVLEPKQLPLFSESLQGYQGYWISEPLDSEGLGTEWHRFKIALEKQHDTNVTVKYFASDHIIVTQEQLAQLWLDTIEDAEDALFKKAIGRYLWISIELVGTDVHTPNITSLEVYFPLQSFVRDLPVMYQRTDQGFLTQYLSIFQTMLEETDLSISSATRKLEATQVDDESLKWLTDWLGLNTDDYWTDEQLRALLKEAPKLLSMRGTKYAIEKLVEIYTGSKPIILEYDDIKPLKENIELAEIVDKLYAADEHTFNVLVKAEDVNSELKKLTLQHILDRYKPMFTTCKLVILQPWVYMDLHSYLGMNTVLTAPQQLLLNGQMSMPHHTITLDIGQHNQLDKHTRIGLNSKLE